MKISIDGRTRNIAFLLFLTLAIILIIITSLAASDQDRLFLSDYVQYMKASQLINQDNYAEAEPILANLVKKNSDTYQILWMYGLCLDGNEKTAEGLKFMKSARETRPALVMNQSYLVQYGYIVYRMGDHTEANRYLLESKNYQQDNNYTKKADQIIQELNSKE